jgi:hypothetical protein
MNEQSEIHEQGGAWRSSSDEVQSRAEFRAKRTIIVSKPDTGLAVGFTNYGKSIKCDWA